MINSNNEKKNEYLSEFILDILGANKSELLTVSPSTPSFIDHMAPIGKKIYILCD